ncbi:MAG: filamentous hemagglutinin N-terminal domain-containing protein [Oscillatoriophycideae cyanobacterium NC_groundwater_1537_Pr4_S-0.65um_50_18]|nr:filamentous hemagglutinin N-terminal domain-containing protein [Oscillatoriophycideae cyanobacterium NC_groundwater_1537_Pr4_S-0.65um_50_18]
MAQSQARWYELFRSLLISGTLALLPLPAVAQRVPIADDSLGNDQSIVSPDEVINNRLSNRINGGARRGANLFHSFREFNIDEGRGVYFANPEGVANILTRVTGGTRSDILGTLGVDGSANLFLLNPNGILFGPNAQLDLRGSFITSTADSFLFDNGFAFGTTDPQAPPLLTVNAPIGLQYGSSLGAIQVQQANLQMPNGQTLTLAGGTVNIQGTRIDFRAGMNLSDRVGLVAPGGRVELAGIAAAGEVGLTRQGQEWRLSVPDGLSRADVVIGNDALVSVAAGGGGSIAITARNFRVTEAQTLIQSGIARGAGTAGAQGGDITINTTENVDLDGVLVLNTTFGVGNAGNITVTASGSISLNGYAALSSGVSSRFFTDLPSGAIGQAGEINVTAGQLFLTNGGFVGVNTAGQGNGGRINITARDHISLDGTDSNIESQVLRGAVGRGGEINITTGTLSVTNGARVSANTEGQGKAGDITVTARDEVRLAGETSELFRIPPSSGISSLVSPFGGQGDGGEINITTGRLLILDGAEVSANTERRGNAGNISITARDAVFISGVGSIRFVIGTGTTRLASNISSQVSPFAIGQGGEIVINTEVLTVRNGGQISASTSGQGDAGNIILTARDAMSFDGVIGSNGSASGTASIVKTGGVGQGGNINIMAGSLSFMNGAGVASSTSGQGDAGNITLTARDAMSFDGIDSDGFPGGAFSSVNSGAIGQGGDIRITADSLSIANGAQVNAATSGQGRAGNIVFDAPTLTVAGNAQVLAETSSTGNGGSILVNAPTSVDLRRTNGASPVLSVETSGAGEAGDITINTPSVTLAEQARITATATDTATNPQGGGSITINASRLNLAGTVGVFAQTQSQSPAGTLTLRPDNNQPNLNIDLSGGAQISASTSSSGRGGDLFVTAPEAIAIQGDGRLSVETTGTGIAGNIEITAPRLTIADGAAVSASTSNTGQGGNLLVNAPVSVLLSNQGRLLTESTGSGRAGNLNINTPRLTLQQGSAISASNQLSAGGDVQLQDLNLLSLDRSSITASTQAGQGGSLQITTREGSKIALDSRSRLAAEATNGGNAGSLTVNNAGRLTLQGRSSATVSSRERGTAGNLTINAETVVLNNGSTIVGTTEAGRGGNINLSIVESLQLNNNSQISAATQSGQGGDITLQDLDSLQVRNSLISAESKTGQAGQLRVNASNSVLLNGATTQENNRVGLSVQSRGGSAGTLSVTTNALSIQNGAAIAVSNIREGNAGDLTINARDISLNRGNITGTTAAGTGGAIQLGGVNLLQLNNQSVISASTNMGRGGSLSINTTNGGDITLSDNSRLAAEAKNGGRAGTLSLNNSGTLNVATRSSITVSSREGNAGNLSINAASVVLDDGTLEAIAGTGNGGNITLNASGRLLQLSNRSQISAQARNNASGGNVTLGVPNGFVVANPFENSDILANAEGQGNGGNIDITTQTIFGLSERNPLSPLSDINASSQFGLDGAIALNTLSTDPTQGLVALPENVAPPNQIDQRCATGSGRAVDEQGSFVITGRGGLPPDVDEALSRDAIQVDLVTVEAAGTVSNRPVALSKTDATSTAIVEAQGWITMANGDVILIGAVPTTIPLHSQHTSSCSAQQLTN